MLEHAGKFWRETNETGTDGVKRSLLDDRTLEVKGVPFDYYSAAIEAVRGFNAGRYPGLNGRLEEGYERILSGEISVEFRAPGF